MQRKKYKSKYRRDKKGRGEGNHEASKRLFLPNDLVQHSRAPQGKNDRATALKNMGFKIRGN